ncbi:hypothetical protein J437_LFUL013912 [Ladona fulva]|nr:hypothetical protein J437_LFUL013912 [Ladona fulva]
MDLHFLLDTADTLQSALESDASRGEVWVKASWALGNLTDAFILNKEEGLADAVPDGPLLELLETCASACQKLPKGGNSADRVRCNAVRAAGNIVRLIDFRGWDEMAGNMSLFSLGKRGKDAVEKIVFTLVDAATKSCDMKVRWNACYAISGLLKNSTLYDNSCAYDDLVTKIVLTLCHLAKLVEKGDLVLLGEIIDPYLENTQSQMISRSHSLVPEKASFIGEAALCLAAFRKNDAASLTRIEDECLSKLIKIFSPDNSKKFSGVYPF